MRHSLVFDQYNTRLEENCADKKVSAGKLRVVMVTSGFPSVQNPTLGVFNFRAARTLSEVCQIRAIHLRTWLPGRPSITSSEWKGVSRITVTVPQIPALDEVNLAVYGLLGWRYLSAVFKNCDLVHSVGIDFASVLASRWANRARVHHVAQIVGSDLNCQRSRAKLLITSIKHTHAVACNSSALRTAFLRIYPEARNVWKVWRGVDLQKFHPDGSAAGPFADRSPTRFLYLGGFPNSPKLPHGKNTKGGETLLDAWKRAGNALSDSSLLIANLPSGDRQVEKWRASLPFPRQVELMGPLHPDAVPGYLRACDAVLVPSLQEGLPNVALEACACGRAVFGTTAGGLPEIIEHGHTGLILPPGDVEALKNALVAYARQPSDLRAMGQRARSRMETYFDAKNYAAQMLEIYQQALREPLGQVGT